MAQQAEQLKRQQLMQQQAESQQFLQQRQQQIDQQDPMQQMPLTQSENMRLQQLQNGLANAHANPDMGPGDLQQIQQQVMPEMQRLQKRQKMQQEQSQQQQKASLQDQVGLLAGIDEKMTLDHRGKKILGPNQSYVTDFDPKTGHLKRSIHEAKTDPMEHYKLQAETQQKLAEFRADRAREAAEMKMQAMRDHYESLQAEKQAKRDEHADFGKEYNNTVSKVTAFLAKDKLGPDGKSTGEKIPPTPQEVDNHIRDYYPHMWNKWGEVYHPEWFGKRPAEGGSATPAPPAPNAPSPPPDGRASIDAGLE